jgi:arylsulfatase
VAVGADPGSPALPDYQPPCAYAGRIKRALVDVSATPVEDHKEQLRMILARQQRLTLNNAGVGRRSQR